MDVYVECMVKRETTKQDRTKQIFLVILCATTFIAGALIFIFLPLFIVALLLTLYNNSKMSALYEYTYVNGELTFTRMTTNRRKKLFTCHMDRVEQVCPFREFRAPGNPKAFAKESDFSSGVENKDTYVMVVNTDKGKNKIIFEPSPELLDGMWRSYPRTVTKRRG